MNDSNQAKSNPPAADKIKKQLWLVGRTVLIALAFGVLAGAVGALIAFNYLSDYLTSIVSPVTTPVVSPAARVVSPGSFESAVEAAENKVKPAMATFYRAKTGETPDESIYFEKDILGYGVVFTSDGWLISSGEILDNIKISGLRVGVGGKLYEAVDMVLDEVTGAVFVKISAENLPVVQLANDDYVASGDRMLTLWGEKNYLSANLVNKEYNPLTAANYLESSENASSRMLLSAAAEKGSIITNYNGEVVGLAWGESMDGAIVLPLEILRPLMISLLKEGDLARPYLGVHYIDLARAIGIDAEISQGRQAGALLWSAEGDESKAVNEGSPAGQAGLQKGDIILSVNGQIINSHSGLARFLLDYNPGDRLSLTVLRDGEELSVNITLASLNDV